MLIAELSLYPMQKTAKYSIFHRRRLGRIEHFNFVENDAMIIQLIFDVIATVLFDSDVTEADDERFDRFDSWIIIIN